MIIKINRKIIYKSLKIFSHYMKLKSCTRKEMVSKLKRPPIEWEKIFVSYTSKG
jgi:hypothetical protein